MLTPLQHNVLLHSSDKKCMPKPNPGWASTMTWLMDNDYIRYRRSSDIYEGAFVPTEKGLKYLKSVKKKVGC